MEIPKEFEDIFRGVDLTEDEIRTLHWLVGWERRTVENLRSAIRKAQATALSTLRAENAQLRGELQESEYDNVELRAELERVKAERDAYQAYFKDLSSKPDCNTCEKRNCEYRPKPGAIVRVNCPLYSGPEKDD